MSEVTIATEAAPEPEPAEAVEAIEAHAEAAVDVIEAQAAADVAVIEAQADAIEAVNASNEEVEAWRAELASVTRSQEESSRAMAEFRTELTAIREQLLLIQTPPQPQPESRSNQESDPSADAPAEEAAEPEPEPEPTPEPKPPERKKAHRWI
jgi:hypothetical protein